MEKEFKGKVAIVTGLEPGLAMDLPIFGRRGNLGRFKRPG